MLTVLDIVELFEQAVPLNLSASFDHNGLVFGHERKEVQSILCSLELTHDIIDQAIANQVDMIFVHHHPLFHATNYLLENDQHALLSIKLIKHGIALYVAHTNLDIVAGGLNDYLFHLVGGTKMSVLDEKTGFGRFGMLQNPMKLSMFIENYIDPLQLSYKANGSNDSEIHKIAVLNGSGSGFLEHAIDKQADLYISGDIQYHDAIIAKEKGLLVLDVGHDFEYFAGIVFKQLLERQLKEYKNTITIHAIESNVFDPWELRKNWP